LNFSIGIFKAISDVNCKCFVTYDSFLKNNIFVGWFWIRCRWERSGWILWIWRIYHR